MELLGSSVGELLGKYGYSQAYLDGRNERVSWDCFIGILAKLQEVLGGPRALEQFGAEVGAAHPLPRALKTLHFGPYEIQDILSDGWLTATFGEVLRPIVRRQPGGTVRVTLSLARDLPPSYAFWTFLLGFWRSLPRLFAQTDALVEVEMADRFAEFLIIFPAIAEEPLEVGREIRRSARKGLLASLIQFEQLLELPQPNLRSSILEHRLESTEMADRPPNGLKLPTDIATLERDVQQLLSVGHVQFYDMSPVGLRRVVGSGSAPLEARIRRMLWMGEQAIGAVEVERHHEEGHSTVASLLDEHIETFAFRFGQIQNCLPLDVARGGFTQADACVRDPTVGEAPPSSRGRVARAARESRLRELGLNWQLTDRQRDVLALLVEGLANKEIAVRLDCSVGTVENHVTRLFKRAAVDCRAALTALFWRTSRPQ